MAIFGSLSGMPSWVDQEDERAAVEAAAQAAAVRQQRAVKSPRMEGGVTRGLEQTPSVLGKIIKSMVLDVPMGLLGAQMQSFDEQFPLQSSRFAAGQPITVSTDDDPRRRAAGLTAENTLNLMGVSGLTPGGVVKGVDASLGAGVMRPYKGPPEDALLAVHNTRSERLAKADELGGLAVPSVAITKPAQGFHSFGDMSLVASPEFVKPGRGNPVFASDVYSPRFPSLNDEGTKIFRGFTDMGNRRYAPMTLDNLVREMKGNVRGGESFNYGAGSVRSAVTPQFGSLADVQGARGKIVPKDVFDPLKAETNDELFKLAQEFRPYSKYSGNQFQHTDDFSSMLGEYARSGLRPMTEHYKDLPPELLDKARTYLGKLRDMPTEYFEAKPQRAVRLDEFKGAVVPEGEIGAVGPILDRNNIKRVEQYGGDSEEARKAARTAALMRFDDLFFSNSTDARTGAAITGAAHAQEARPFGSLAGGLPMDEASRLQRAKELGFDTEKRWYHGTNAPEFNAFSLKSHSKASGTALENPAIFMTNDPALAGSYANASGTPMRSGYTWGEYRDEVQKPVMEVLGALPEPIRKLLHNSRWADEVVAGNVDLKALREHGVSQEHVDKLQGLMLRNKANEEATQTVPGARVMPLTARGDFMPMSMFPGFNEDSWDFALREAKKRGQGGVHFKGVVDSPSGRGDPADVLAVFDQKNIRSINAAFDPANANKGFLLGANAGDKRAAALVAGAEAQQPFGSLAPSGIRAYHSSPYDFDKFDLSKIGTGQGAQSYGHGIYAAENEKVSGFGGQYWQEFASRFKDDPVQSRAIDRLKQNGFDRQKAAAGIDEELDWYEFNAKHSLNPQAASKNEKLHSDLVKARDLLLSDKPVGPRTYEVNINAKPEQFLDWDKPLSGQPSSVVDPLVSLVGKHGLMDPRERGSMQSIMYDLGHAKVTGSPANATAALREGGIPGIRYLDQGSRGPASAAGKPDAQAIAKYQSEWDSLVAERRKAAGDLGRGDTSPVDARMDAIHKRMMDETLARDPNAGRTSNYVLFDDSLVDILRKYAMPGAVGTGATWGSMAPGGEQ